MWIKVACVMMETSLAKEMNPEHLVEYLFGFKSCKQYSRGKSREKVNKKNLRTKENIYSAFSRKIIIKNYVEQKWNISKIKKGTLW